MKELSIEEKAKRYDEVIAMAKECITYIPDEAVNKYMFNMFPELKEKESKGETIRKELTTFIKRKLENSCAPTPSKDILANWVTWLEKQGEQKSVEWHREDEQNLNACLGYILDESLKRWLKDVIHAKYDKSADKVKPKFKVGDWIIDKQGLVYQIENVVENVTNHTFGYDIVGGGYFNDSSDVRLWNIKDVKDGDVLATKDGAVFIFKHINKAGLSLYKSYCEVIGNSGLGLGFDFAINSVHPATKEQRSTLFARMKEAGYEWNEDKKELIKL